MSTPTSSIIAGTMNWGEWGKNYNTTEIQQLIATCLAENICAFDHADIYGGYTTEAAFGNAWAAMNVDRESVHFITKCGIKYVCDQRDYGIKHYDYSKEHLISSVENSLKNLTTDYVDVLLLHRPSPLMQTEVVAEAISELNSIKKQLPEKVTKKEISEEIIVDKFSRNTATKKYLLIDNDKKFNDFLKIIKTKKAFAYDTETSGLNPINSELLGLSFSFANDEAYYLDLSQGKVQKSADLFSYQKAGEQSHPWLEILKPILENAKIKKYFSCSL